MRTKKLLAIREKFAQAGKMLQECLRELDREVVVRLEDLPINRDGMARKPILFFVLDGEEWIPAHDGHELSEGVFAGWLNFRTDYADGSAESGTARPYEWAHCTADELPDYHWLRSPEEASPAPS